jgi:hypothetical protein
MKSRWLVTMMGIVTVSWNTHASPTTVVAWGKNDHGQTNIPTGLTNVVAIAQGAVHGLALNSDGTVIAWGSNYAFTTPPIYEGQATPPPGISNVISIAAGYYSSLALKNDGSITYWGETNQANLPVGLTNLVAVTTVGNHCLALRNDGVLFNWGDNFLGSSTLPLGLTNVVAIGESVYDGIAIHSNGTLTVWGDNGYGQTNVPANGTNVMEATGGNYHVLALRGDGTVIAWGNNSYGQINVPAGLSNVVQIAAGDYHNLALKKDGTVVAWGQNNYGQSTIPLGLSNVVMVAGCGSQSLALMNDGSPWIKQQPLSLTTFSGMNSTFNVLAIGTTTVNYQWYFNGTNILGATNAFLSLTNVQTTNSGNYSVIVSNAVGVVASSNAVFAVSNSPPFISQPVSQFVVALHSNALVTVTSSGSLPQFYRWQFKGSNITAATNAFLSLTNAQFTNGGNYTVIITNAYGSTTGLVASLIIMDLGTALNATNLVWSTSSSYPWFPEISTNHDGIAAAQSATPPYPQYSTLQSSVTGPGTLTFWAECSQSLDTYVFSAAGNYGQTVFIPPFPQWVQETVYLGTGTQALQWQFRKSIIGGSGLDAAWLDQVSFVPGTTPAMVTAISPNQIVPVASNVTFTVSAVGTPPLSFQWAFNGSVLSGATNFSLSLTNVQLTNAGVYSITVTNAYGEPVTTNAVLLVQLPQFDTSPGNMFMSSEGFVFQLGGLTGHGPIIIFASTDLLSWLPIFTNPPVVGTMQFSDTNAAYLPFRFYRAAEQ